MRRERRGAGFIGGESGEVAWEGDGRRGAGDSDVRALS